MFHSKSPVVRPAEIRQARANIATQNTSVTSPHAQAGGNAAKRFRRVRTSGRGIPI